MELITRRLQTEIPAKEFTQIEDWWNKLSPENQTELEALYLDEEKHQDNIVSMTLHGEFMDYEDGKDEGEDAYWLGHYYQYIIDRGLIFLPTGTARVCSATNSAEAAIRKAFIPQGYVCPLQKDNCPMINILKENPGKSVELRVKFKLKKRQGC